jgi:hypothetical protein
MRQKIDASYMSKLRAKQITEKQARGLEERIEEAEKEAEMIAAGKRAAAKKEAERLAVLEQERENMKAQLNQMESRKDLEREARN